MVTQDSYCTVGLIVREDLFSNAKYTVKISTQTSEVSIKIENLRSILLRGLIQLLLECDGSVVSTEHLGRESIHQTRQMLVQFRRVEPIEKIIRAALVFHKDFDIFVDALEKR